MKNLLTEAQAKKLSFLDNINDCFKLPTIAYIHGKDIDLLEQIGASLYFSNYWYGPKDLALSLAENLAHFYKKAYEEMEPESDRYDFFGMVMFWDNGNNALVGNINIEADIYVENYDDVMPKDDNMQLKKILDDGNDNSVFMLETSVLTLQEKQELLNLIPLELQEYYPKDDVKD